MLPKIKASGFAGDLLCADHVKFPGVQPVFCKAGGNSGAAAILVAAHFGAYRIIIFGCDCRYTTENGKEKRHWHWDHDKKLGNAVSVGYFYEQFRQVHMLLFRAKIINCSEISKLRDLWGYTHFEEALWPEKTKSAA